MISMFLTENQKKRHLKMMTSKRLGASIQENFKNSEILSLDGEKKLFLKDNVYMVDIVTTRQALMKQKFERAGVNLVFRSDYNSMKMPAIDEDIKKRLPSSNEAVKIFLVCFSELGQAEGGSQCWFKNGNKIDTANAIAISKKEYEATFKFQLDDGRYLYYKPTLTTGISCFNHDYHGLNIVYPKQIQNKTNLELKKGGCDIEDIWLHCLGAKVPGSGQWNESFLKFLKTKDFITIMNKRVELSRSVVNTASHLFDLSVSYNLSLERYFLKMLNILLTKGFKMVKLQDLALFFCGYYQAPTWYSDVFIPSVVKNNFIVDDDLIKKLSTNDSSASGWLSHKYKTTRRIELV